MSRSELSITRLLKDEISLAQRNRLLEEEITQDKKIIQLNNGNNNHND